MTKKLLMTEATFEDLFTRSAFSCGRFGRDGYTRKLNPETVYKRGGETATRKGGCDQMSSLDGRMIYTDLKSTNEIDELIIKDRKHQYDEMVIAAAAKNVAGYTVVWCHPDLEVNGVFPVEFYMFPREGPPPRWPMVCRRGTGIAAVSDFDVFHKLFSQIILKLE